MNKKLLLTFMACALSSCTYFQKGAGQVVYHWEKPHTGVEKFSRDLAGCLMAAKEFTLMPDFRSWFYTEVTKLDTRAIANFRRSVQQRRLVLIHFFTRCRFLQFDVFA